MKQNIISALMLGGLCAQTLAADTETGFQNLCNGTDLTGWDGNPKLWSVKAGAIVGQTSTEHPITANTFLIWTNGTTGDFELRCSFRITANNPEGFANSGIQYRSKVVEPAGWVVGGYQADMEAGATYTGILYDERGVAGGRGIMAARGEKVIWNQDCQKQVTGSLGKAEEIQATIKPHDWNDYVIIASGNHLQHFINGKPTVDVTDECEGKALKSGVLALQLHAGGAMTVEFKNLRIKTGAATAAASGEAQRFNGSWGIDSSEANGSPLPAEDLAGLTLTIVGEKYSVTRDGQTDHGVFSVDATKAPKQMDVRPETGPGAGKLIRAIYEFNADTLRVCYATQDGTERPASFTTAPDSGQVRITYKRKQP